MLKSKGSPNWTQKGTQKGPQKAPKKGSGNGAKKEAPEVPKPFEFLVFGSERCPAKVPKWHPKWARKGLQKGSKGYPFGVPNLFILFEFGGPLIYSELRLPTPE